MSEIGQKILEIEKIANRYGGSLRGSAKFGKEAADIDLFFSKKIDCDNFLLLFDIIPTYSLYKNTYWCENIIMGLNVDTSFGESILLTHREELSYRNRNNTSFISLDCETNGLYGKIYSVAMAVYRNGVPTEKICLSCNIEEEHDAWLLKNPHLVEVEGSEKLEYFKMMQIASDFYKFHSCRNNNGEVVESFGKPNYQTTPILYHCGMIVEGGFFRSLRELGLIGLFDAPMCPIEVGNFLRNVGENPLSVDAYIKKFNIEKADGFTHNPMYDCEQAANAYLHIIGFR